MAVLLKRHKGLLDNPTVDVGEDPIITTIDKIDIMSLPSPLSIQQQLDSIEIRQGVLVSMSFDSVYDDKTRERIAVRSRIPIKNDYIPPLNYLLEDSGINLLKPYRVLYCPSRCEYIFYQRKVLIPETLDSGDSLNYA